MKCLPDKALDRVNTRKEKEPETQCLRLFQCFFHADVISATVPPAGA